MKESKVACFLETNLQIESNVCDARASSLHVNMDWTNPTDPSSHKRFVDSKKFLSERTLSYNKFVQDVNTSNGDFYETSVRLHKPRQQSDQRDYVKMESKIEADDVTTEEKDKYQDNIFPKDQLHYIGSFNQAAAALILCWVYRYLWTPRGVRKSDLFAVAGEEGTVWPWLPGKQEYQQVKIPTNHPGREEGMKVFRIMDTSYVIKCLNNNPLTFIAYLIASFNFSCWARTIISKGHTKRTLSQRATSTRPCYTPSTKQS